MIHRENEILISYPEVYNDDYCSMCVTDHMQGLVKHAIKFLVQCHHELQKKNRPKKYAPNNYYSKRQSIKHVLSKTSDFRPDTLLNYLSTCYSWTLITKNMIVFSLKTKQFGLLLSLVYAHSTEVWSQWTTKQTTWKWTWTVFKQTKCHKQLQPKRKMKNSSLVFILP